MSDETRARRPDPALRSALAAGAMSGILYVSVLFSFAFLVPVQTIYGRQGRRAGMLAALAAALAVAAVQTIRILRLEGIDAATMVALLIGVASPLLLLAALVGMNAPFWSRYNAIYRVFGLASALALVALPGIVIMRTDPGLRSFLEGAIRSTLTKLLGGEGAGGQGYEAAAFAASFDPAAIVAQTLDIIACSFAAFFFLLLGGSWLLGNRSSGEGSPGRTEAPALAELRLPYALVWPALGAWALVLVSTYFKLGILPRAIAWNAALLLSAAYAAQGLGIVSFFFTKWSMPRFLRIVFGASYVALLTVPPYGIAVAAILPLLGFTEVWIPYRTPKGVGA